MPVTVTGWPCLNGSFQPQGELNDWWELLVNNHAHMTMISSSRSKLLQTLPNLSHYKQNLGYEIEPRHRSLKCQCHKKLAYHTAEIKYSNRLKLIKLREYSKVMICLTCLWHWLQEFAMKLLSLTRSAEVLLMGTLSLKSLGMFSVSCWGETEEDSVDATGIDL